MFFVFISPVIDMEATKSVLVFLGQGNQSACFQVILDFDNKWLPMHVQKSFLYQILKVYSRYNPGRYVFLLLRPGFSLKVTWSAFERKKFLKLVLEIWISITKFSDIKKSWIICFLLSIVLLREGFKKNYETYNNKQKETCFCN